MNGNIIDVYPDNKKNVMVTWLTGHNRVFKIEDNYSPSFYVYSKREKLINLATLLRDFSQIESLNFNFEKITLGSDKKKFVLEVTPKKLESLRKLSETIDSWGGYHDYLLFNVDLRLSSRYLQDKFVFCNAKVKWDGKKFISEDEEWAIDYSIPDYKTTTFDIKRRTKNKIFSFEDPIKSIIIGENVICEGNEADTILLAVKQLKHIDPDIIYTNKGDSVKFPYLYHRAKLSGIQNSLTLGRDEKKPLNPTKNSREPEKARK